MWVTVAHTIMFHPEQLITKMEDAANICSSAKTLLCEKLWVWFWTIPEMLADQDTGL